jgi:hypothetical protein
VKTRPIDVIEWLLLGTVAGGVLAALGYGFVELLRQAL